ncbi:MAG TPA: glycosyltransferase 87 family protein [Gemmatimonadota bacterium]|nr:glycosyltransferase 87 family protein [Gemmatimonadota bacterium]
MLAVAALAGIVIGARLTFEVHRLLFQPHGAIDLLLYRELIRDWFAETPVYIPSRGAVHPPATFLVLWPLFGWGTATIIRWWYAVTTGLVIGLFARLLLREARPANRMDRGLLAVLIVASYPAAITIGNGQITFHVLLAALMGVLIQRRRTPDIRWEAPLSALFLIALVKPHLTLPFFWTVAFTRGWARPAVLTGIGYLAATGAAFAFHGAGLEGLQPLVAAWFHKSQAGATMAGYGNLHIWLGGLGLGAWILGASALAFALHGLWAWRHRGADAWVQIGVAAIVARLWAYHRVYDDLLLVFPLIALYRMARRDAPDRVAWALFLLGAVTLAAPITPILEEASWALVAVWLLQLGYLGWRAEGERRYRGRVSAS